MIGAVNLKFSNAAFTNLAVTGPSTTPSWSAVLGPINNGCNATANSTFVCALASNYGSVNNQHGGVLIAQGGSYTWTWTYDPIAANQIFAVGSIHIGADYNPHNGLIVSQTGAVAPPPPPPPTVPEPTSLLLIGGGLIAMGAVRRRLRM